MKIINSFSGDFHFLSNFSPHGFFDKDGLYWKTSEHYYQAHKAIDKHDMSIVRYCDKPSRAKRIGQNIDIRKDWRNVKISIMWDALKMKFDQNHDIRKKLKLTFDFKLIEGNYWHDNFWGNCLCTKCEKKAGENYLGTLLMILRDEYIKRED